MNFTYEQVMDMGFPSPKYYEGQVCITGLGVILTYESASENLKHHWFRDANGGLVKFYTILGDLPVALPSLDKVFNSLRSGLYLKCSGWPDSDRNFQFWLVDPGFDDKFYASGKTLADAICNAYIRGKHRPTNP